MCVQHTDIEDGWRGPSDGSGEELLSGKSVGLRRDSVEDKGRGLHQVGYIGVSADEIQSAEGLVCCRDKPERFNRQADLLSEDRREESEQQDILSVFRLAEGGIDNSDMEFRCSGST